jgi:hypothetical protein
MILEKNTIGIAVTTFPPYQEGQNLLSNSLEKLKFPCVFIEANTEAFCGLAIGTVGAKDLDEQCNEWNVLLAKVHPFSLISLAESEDYPEVKHWIIMDDDLFFSPAFKAPLRKLLGALPQNFDAVLLNAETILPRLSVKYPFEILISTKFPPLSQVGAYMVPVERMGKVAEALQNGTQDTLNTFAFLAAPPMIHQFRDDILPCLLRQGQEKAFPEAEAAAPTSENHV